MNRIPFQCLESVEPIGCGITREIWFVTIPDGTIVRRTLYKAEDGSVVAFQDCGKGVDTALYVETMFYELNKGECPWIKIQTDSGVYGTNHIHLFDMR